MYLGMFTLNIKPFSCNKDYPSITFVNSHVWVVLKYGQNTPWVSCIDLFSTSKVLLCICDCCNNVYVICVVFSSVLHWLCYRM